MKLTKWTFPGCSGEHQLGSLSDDIIRGNQTRTTSKLMFRTSKLVFTRATWKSSFCQFHLLLHWVLLQQSCRPWMSHPSVHSRRLNNSKQAQARRGLDPWTRSSFLNNWMHRLRRVRIQNKIPDYHWARIQNKNWSCSRCSICHKKTSSRRTRI